MIIHLKGIPIVLGLWLLFGFVIDIIVIEVWILTPRIDPSCMNIVGYKSSVLGQKAKMSSPSPNILIRTFHHFPHLPLEIRLQIWTHALPAPRTIPVKQHLYYLPSSKNVPVEHTYFTTDEAPPSMLTVCRESREVALTWFDGCVPATEGSKWDVGKEGKERDGKGVDGSGTDAKVMESKAIIRYRKETERLEVTNLGDLMVERVLFHGWVGEGGWGEYA